jgi:Ca2+-binding RTX toxin-like protein
MALFVGTNGNDTISPATISAGVLIVPAGSDLSGNDNIASLEGDDVVEPDTGDDVAALGGGDDRFIWNPGDGDDTVEGGADTDTLEFNGAGGVDIMTVTTLEEGRFLFFRDPADITIDATNVEVIEANGLGGNDIIIAALQTDPEVSLIVDGGDGNDFIIGGAGDDDIEGGTGDDVAFGGGGNDRFTWNPGDGDDTFDGSLGEDTLEFNGSGAAELMTIASLGDNGFLFSRDVGEITVRTFNTETVEVTALGGNDTVDGSAQPNPDIDLEIAGGAGDDSITGGAGADTFIFGAETNNGVVEIDRIAGYSQDQGDVVDLFAAGGPIIAEEVVGDDLRLTLAGGDNDLLIIEGVTSSADVTFRLGLPTEPLIL